MERRLLLARKYARAVLNVFGGQISPDDITRVRDIVSFLSTRRKALFFLKLSRIESNVKVAAVEHLFEGVSDTRPFVALMRLLLDDKRGDLIYQVLCAIVELYQEIHKIMPFTVTSSHNLSNDEQDTVKQFLARQTRNDIIYTYRQDASLIAGLRLQSKTLLWERSIQKKLRSLALYMAPKG